MKVGSISFLWSFHLSGPFNGTLVAESTSEDAAVLGMIDLWGRERTMIPVVSYVLKGTK